MSLLQQVTSKQEEIDDLKGRLDSLTRENEYLKRQVQSLSEAMNRSEDSRFPTTSNNDGKIAETDRHSEFYGQKNNGNFELSPVLEYNFEMQPNLFGDFSFTEFSDTIYG